MSLEQPINLQQPALSLTWSVAVPYANNEKQSIRTPQSPFNQNGRFVRNLPPPITEGHVVGVGWRPSQLAGDSLTVLTSAEPTSTTATTTSIASVSTTTTATVAGHFKEARINSLLSLLKDINQITGLLLV